MKYDIPFTWVRQGMVLPRNADGPGCHVVGDPCIVRDEAVGGWRMFLFFNPPGHGHAVCLTPEAVGPGHWSAPEPLAFTNPEALLGGATHKPYVVMDPYHANQAACVDGRYYLLTISMPGGHKVAQRATASTLGGPWTLEPEPCIPLGDANTFDAKHVDAVSGYYFPEREVFLYFYMGYPAQAQPRQVSAYGSAQAVAIQQVGESSATKQGIILPPCQQPGHWASGWVGGLQLLPGLTHRWIAVLNASPTAPDATDTQVSREEPPPSLGGFVYCDEEWPVANWHWSPEPIEWIHAIPQVARQTGEGHNFWRQHLLVLPTGRLALFYNSGYYGQEQMYLKLST